MAYPGACKARQNDEAWPMIAVQPAFTASDRGQVQQHSTSGMPDLRNSRKKPAKCSGVVTAKSDNHFLPKAACPYMGVISEPEASVQEA
jgi:hypothetical protein